MNGLALSVRLALAGALVLIVAGCGGSTPHVPAYPTPAGEVWTETALDDAIVTALDGCHVRSETTAGGESRVRESWEAPDSSFSLAFDGRTVQVRVQVTRGPVRLEAFGSLPAEEAFEPSVLLAALAHPRRARLPESSSLFRIYREERGDEVVTLEEFGGPAYRGRTLTHERNDGETSDLHAHGQDWSMDSRVWVDVQGRHLETRARRGEDETVRSTLEERGAQGRVVAEHHSAAAYGETDEWTTTLSYDDAGRLTAIDDSTIEVMDEGQTTTTCTQYYCSREDAAGRLLTFGPRDSEPTTTIRRDDQGRVVEVQRIRNDETRTTTVTRDTDGHRERVANPHYTITGDWEADRLIRATTRMLHEGEMVESKNLTRTYDEHGRLTRSVVVDQGLRSRDARPWRSEMRITYAGCSPTVEVMIDPEHLSPLESLFELIE